MKCGGVMYITIKLANQKTNQYLLPDNDQFIEFRYVRLWMSFCVSVCLTWGWEKKPGWFKNERFIDAESA